jgi:hypothetical protein
MLSPAEIAPAAKLRPDLIATGTVVPVVWKSTVTCMYYSPIDASLPFNRFDVCFGETCVVTVHYLPIYF